MNDTPDFPVDDLLPHYDDYDLSEAMVEFDPQELETPSSSLSPLQELIQSVAPTIPPITAAVPTRGARWREMQDARALAQKRLNELVKNDAVLSQITNEHYGMRFEAAPFMRAKPGTSRIYQAIINHILSRSGAEKTQTQIRAYIAEMFSSNSVPKDWTKPLPSWAIKKAKELIKNSPAPICNIKLPKGVTLSELHRAAAIAIERHKTGAQTFKPIIEVRDDSITINSRVFPISKNKVKDETYRQVRISLPKLLQALASAR